MTGFQKKKLLYHTRIWTYGKINEGVQNRLCFLILIKLNTLSSVLLCLNSGSAHILIIPSISCPSVKLTVNILTFITVILGNFVPLIFDRFTWTFSRLVSAFRILTSTRWTSTCYTTRFYFILTFRSNGTFDIEVSFTTICEC